MDTNTDRIINLLLATSKDGDLAESLTDEITETLTELLETVDLDDAVVEASSAFVAALIDDVVRDVVASRGNREILAAIIGTSYATGLMFGLSIATLAAEA